MRKAVVAGSFDPITNGHLDIIERSSELFDEVIVVLSHNVQKNYLFSLDERKLLVEKVIAHVPNAKVVAVSGGLTVEAAAQLGASVLVRGVRNATDFEYEATLASHNRVQNSEVETVLLLSKEEDRFVSSSMMKELARFGGAVTSFVPSVVADALQEKYKDAPERTIKMEEEITDVKG